MIVSSWCCSPTWAGTLPWGRYARQHLPHNKRLPPRLASRTDTSDMRKHQTTSRTKKLERRERCPLFHRSFPPGTGTAFFLLLFTARRGGSFPFLSRMSSESFHLVRRGFFPRAILLAHIPLARRSSSASRAVDIGRFSSSPPLLYQEPF